jgi:hypothetical protein
MAGKRPKHDEKLKEQHLAEFREQLAFERLQERNPQQWVAFQRVHKLVDIQEQMEGGCFPPGGCFLHASVAGSETFCVRRVTGIDLDAYQATFEIYGDEELDEGIVVLPLETVEWFGFPSQAVPPGIHFQGFTGFTAPRTAGSPRPRAETDQQPSAGTDGDGPA